MSVEMKSEYLGELHCQLTHGPSGTHLDTDAPVDNKGRGQAFSPTDLVGAALLSCALTTMAIAAEADGVSLNGSHGRVVKDMQLSPRKIAKLTLEIVLPESVTAAQRERFAGVAQTCPVARSLGSDVVVEMTFR